MKPTQRLNINPKTKSKGLHIRNLHSGRYDFPALCETSPELAAVVSVNAHGDQSIDFSDPHSVKLLNQALLKHFYQVSFWDIPANYLCPPIPGRADYLHYIADLLAESHSLGADEKTTSIPTGKQVAVLDIGMGANCIYPILGTRLFGWKFVGSDIDPVSVKSANTIVDMNASLKGRIRCRLQSSSEQIFTGVIKHDELFDITVCNPPFHQSLAEATRGAERKVANLTSNKRKKAGLSHQQPVTSGKAPTLNFGGQGSELWCPGGEVSFITQMVNESADYAHQCLWFTSLVSKKESLPAIYSALKSVNAIDVKTINMTQGSKITRIVAWTFMDSNEQAQWCEARWS